MVCSHVVLVFIGMGLLPYGGLLPLPTLHSAVLELHFSQSHLAVENAVNCQLMSFTEYRFLLHQVPITRVKFHSSAVVIAPSLIN